MLKYILTSSSDIQAVGKNSEDIPSIKLDTLMRRKHVLLVRFETNLIHHHELIHKHL